MVFMVSLIFKKRGRKISYLFKLIIQFINIIPTMFSSPKIPTDSFQMHGLLVLVLHSLLELPQF